MRPTTKRIATDIAALNKVPAVRRSTDWRTAKGLLEEAAGYIKLGNDTQAELMRKAAAPYLRFAELV
jgi:hypothetical protein